MSCYKCVKSRPEGHAPFLTGTGSTPFPSPSISLSSQTLQGEITAHLGPFLITLVGREAQVFLFRISSILPGGLKKGGCKVHLQPLVGLLNCTDFVCLNFRCWVISRNYQERHNDKTSLEGNSRVNASDSGVSQNQVEVKDRDEPVVRKGAEGKARNGG